MKLLDLFCGQGGAAAGYIAAGFDVTGVDLADHSVRYPGAFVQADALAYLIEHGHEYDAIHASPPCQGYSRATAGNLAARGKYKRLIAAARELLSVTDRPWVIENVEQARRQMVDPIVLCGRMGRRVTIFAALARGVLDAADAVIYGFLDAVDAVVCAIANATHEPLDHESDD